MRTSRRIVNLDTIANDATRIKNVMAIDRKHAEGMGTLMKDAILLKLSS